MKRAIYFFTDRLQISIGERISILTLGAIVLLITGASSIYPAVYQDDMFNYDEFTAAFAERIAMVEHEREALLDQYYPESLPEKTSNKLQAAETISGAEAVTKTEDTRISESTPAAGADKIDINKANSEVLMKLPGIGPAIAARIVEYRKQNGPFKTIEDIKKVRGIGEARFDNIKDKIKVSD